MLKDMLDACGLSRSALSNMQSGGSLPRVENIAKIADYLECSVDYLIGRTDNPKLSNREAEIVNDAVAASMAKLDKSKYTEAEQREVESYLRRASEETVEAVKQGMLSAPF